MAFTVTGEDLGGDDGGKVVFTSGGGVPVTVSLTAGQTVGTATLTGLADGTP